MQKLYILIILFAVLTTVGCAQTKEVNPEAKIFKYSTFIEKERPELNEATKTLIAAYHRNPSQVNYDALKRQVEANYDAVIARKQAKLEELRKEAHNQDIITQMEGMVDEVVKDRDHRVAQTMARFTDKRMRPGARTVHAGFLPLIDAKGNVSVAYTPVTNKEYAAYDKHHTYPKGQDNYPVVNVSYPEALGYCKWLSAKDGKTYRLPTQDEWELAAGHMPKDADFNCGIGKGLTAVDAHAKTTGACGGIDFWGNCWEWTSTQKVNGEQIVKGGSWDSNRMACRTEYRDESRQTNKSYDNVGFRIVREG